MILSVLGLLAVFLLLFLGLPIAFGMGIVGFVGYAYLSGIEPASVTLVDTTLEVVMNQGLSVLPLFVLMGNLITLSGLSGKLFAASNAFLGHRRGGLSLATIMACGGFSAVCGSSLATAATMAKVAMPSMRRYGYADSLAAGSIAAGGTLGILIPPSTILIIYGILTETDIGKLFVAGIVPGIIGIALYMGAVWFTTLRHPEYGPRGERTPWPGRLQALAKVWGVLALLLLVIGGIYLGVFTPTEAAGIGASGAFFFALMDRSLTWARLRGVFVESARTTAILLSVLIGALVFSNFINIANAPRAIVDWLSGLDVAPIAVIFIILGVYLVLGCILESLSMMLLTVPILVPVVLDLGFDLIWFGILVVVAIEISLITPPIGINVFVLKSVLPDVRTSDIFRGVMPFIAADTIRLLLLVLFPAIVLFLPGFM